MSMEVRDEQTVARADRCDDGNPGRDRAPEAGAGPGRGSGSDGCRRGGKDSGGPYPMGRAEPAGYLDHRVRDTLTATGAVCQPRVFHRRGTGRLGWGTSGYPWARPAPTAG